ncbi:MAG: hypothetical protein CVU11_09725 [Bacteroidetes bacterium HGW-Bacteroidetes-6]|jgi:hypothetical protein|nr:MAG: hypothetical protein CVU11_09725 [Bacteroidetes bacterium HGW-Bacteroidetes-6]
MIDTNNYIEYIVDFYDGKLSETATQALMDFMSIRPNIREEFEDYGESFENNSFENMEAPLSLKNKLMSIPETGFSMNEQWLVAYTEGDLSGSDEETVRRIIETDIYWSREHRTMAAARMTPDRSIVFPNKEALLQHEKSGALRRFMYIASAAAAALVVSYMLWSPSEPGNGMQNNNRIARTEIPLPRVYTPQQDTTTNKQKFFDYNNNPVNNNIQSNRNNYELAMLPIESKTVSPLKEKPTVLPSYLDDKRTEYLAIYEYSELRLAMENQPKDKTGGTLDQWKDWGLALVSGNGSVKDNPASDISFREVTTLGISTLNRFTENNMSFAIKK